jgi:hypothetical protein
MPATVTKLQQLVHEDWLQTIQELADDIRIGYVTCQWILTDELGIHCITTNFCPGFWQLIKSSSVSASSRSFVISPPTMEPSCPGLSLVTRAGFMVMILRKSNNPPNGKVQGHQDRKRRDRWRAKPRACSSFSLRSRGLFTKYSS